MGIAPTQGQDISDDGVVVGYYSLCTIGPEVPFIWTAETGVEAIPMPDGTSNARAYGIDGSLVVGYAAIANDDGFGQQAFVYDLETGEIEIIPPPKGGNFTDAFAVSNGRVVGIWGNTLIGKPSQEAFIWEDGVMMSLAPDLGTATSQANDVNSAGIVTGWMGDSIVFDGNAYIWNAGEVGVIPLVPGGFLGVGAAINERGDVVGLGGVFDENLGHNVALAFAYVDGEMHVIEPFEGFEDSRASDISDNGLVVGYSGLVAFAWYRGELVALNDLVDPSLAIGLKYPQAIHPDGTIVCQGVINEFEAVTFLLQPVFAPLGDLDEDGVVGVSDLIILLGAWGPCRGDCPADLDKNGVVGTTDLIILLGNWG